MPKIEKLTSEQEALIPVYREKWRKIALSTEPIDQERATKAIKEMYTFLSKKEPEILFFSSPHEALELIMSMLRTKFWSDKIGRPLAEKIQCETKFTVEMQIRLELEANFDESFRKALRAAFDVWFPLEGLLSLISSLSLIRRDLDRWGTLKYKFFRSKFCSYISSEEQTRTISFYDFCISVLNCNYCPPSSWAVFQTIAESLYWFFPYENICFVCDRPRTLQFDSENRLHAEGEPAIQFADDYSLYSYHGVILPEKYGKIHPNQWQANWILAETNAELRRVLIQGIGYARICQELQAVELDSWQEYTLLKIAADADVEPIVLLKMTCPSTGHIHALRVPPAMISAREAVCWINHGINPEDFAVQT
jgi:hypothetical protein